MIRIELSETGSAQCALTPEQGRLLADSGLVAAAPSAYGLGLWDITAAGKVGVARLGDLELRIAPKLAIERLFFLLGYAANPRGWRDETVELETHEDLVPAVAEALWRQSERAVRRGLLQGYLTREEAASVLRGRLREADQLRRHHGRILPMELRYDDFTVDIAENQILLAAISRMLTVPRIGAESRRRLLVLRGKLAEVTTVVRGGALPDWQPNRLNLRYHSAVRLAEIVWRATSPEHALGAVAATGFMFDLPKIFEDFVSVAFAESVQLRIGGIARPQYRCHLDVADEVRIRPDLVWELRGRPMAVLDAKYKQEKPAGYPDADLYQLLAYCTALGLPRGHLVYAAGNVEPARHVVRGAGIELVCHALDLSAQPDSLLRQVDRLVDDVVTVASAA